MSLNKPGNSSIYFSIILISYNHDDFFSDALNSVINQIYDKSRLELIVVCKSFGKPIDIVKNTQFNFEVKLVINDDLSPGVKYKAAFQIARYEWIALLDDDDMWRSDKLLVLSDLILKNDGLIYIHNSKKFINDEFHFNNIGGENIKEVKIDDFKMINKEENNLINCIHNNSSITFKKQIISNYEYLLANMPGGTDLYLFASARLFHGKLLCLNQDLTYFRIGQKNYKFNNAQLIGNLTRQLKSYYAIKGIIQNDPKLSTFLQKEIISNQMKLNILGDLKYNRNESFRILKTAVQLKTNINKEFLVLWLLFGITLINRKFVKRIYEFVTTSHNFK